MSDPAVVAARRARRALHRGVMDEYIMVAAAREALQDIREIHRPFTRDWPGSDGRTVCVHCLGPIDWPCLTARAAYPSEELE